MDFFRLRLKSWKTIPLVATLLLLAGGRPCVAQEAERPKAPAARAAAFNVGLTSAFALVRGLAEGHIESPRDALRVAVAGAVSGYGFYQSKRLIGRSHEAAGMALAYASASVTENTGQGRHPLSHLRLGPGPADLRLRTPWARADGPVLTVEINAGGAVAAVVLPLAGYRPAFRGGTLVFLKSTPLNDYMPTIHAGRALGRAILLYDEAPPFAKRHELIHFAQALQVGAVTPYHTLSDVWPRFGGARERRLVGWDVQIDWLYGALGGLSALVPYEQRWAGIEAFSLQSPPPKRSEPPCPDLPPGSACQLNAAP